MHIIGTFQDYLHIILFYHISIGDLIDVHLPKTTNMIIYPFNKI